MKKIEEVGFVNWIKQIGNSMVPTASVPSYQQKKHSTKQSTEFGHTHTHFPLQISYWKTKKKKSINPMEQKSESSKSCWMRAAWNKSGTSPQPK